MFVRRFLIALAIGIAACAEPVGPELAGHWGGPDASLVLAPTGGTAEYGCGAGTIATGWTVTPEGRWSASGVHRFGGGPAPIEGHPAHPASYAGQIQGDRLTFRVILTDLQETLGPFTVERGKAFSGTQCL